jgi:phosphatidylglycerol lysyltransferase
MLLLGFALFVVYREVHSYGWTELRRSIGAISGANLLAALGFTLLGYAVLTAYDWLGLEYSRQRLLYRQVGPVALLGFAISNNVGHALVSGGSVRLRFYSGWGVPVSAIARVLLFCSATYLIGATALLALCLLGPMLLGPVLLGLPFAQVTDKLAPRTLLLFGVLAVAVQVVWWSAVVLLRRPLVIKGFSLELPRPWLALRQLLVGTADLLLVSLVLFLPLSQLIDISYPVFLLLFLLAQLTGLASQVPGARSLSLVADPGGAAGLSPHLLFRAAAARRGATVRIRSAPQFVSTDIVSTDIIPTDIVARHGQCAG